MSRKYRVFAELLAVRALALVAMALLSSVGLYVGSRGAELRAFQRARANGEFDGRADCPTVVRTEGARIESEELDELSGMTASHHHADMYWVHNDSGDSARIFAITSDGVLRAEVILDGVEAVDFEDISQRDGVLYVADTGNNLKARKTVRIHVLPEPRVPREGSVVELHRTPRTVDITYEDGRHDVEAMFVDARGDVYLVDKAHVLSYLGRDGVYRVTAEEMKKGRAVARKVAEVGAGPATAAAISPDGSALAVRNYFVALWWPLAKGEAVVDAFAKKPCYLRIREWGLQGEALTFTNDGFVTLSEGRHPRILHYRYGPPELLN